VDLAHRDVQEFGGSAARAAEARAPHRSAARGHIAAACACVWKAVQRARERTGRRSRRQRPSRSAAWFPARAGKARALRWLTWVAPVRAREHPKMHTFADPNRRREFFNCRVSPVRRINSPRASI
jgi:hypothetical protein